MPCNLAVTIQKAGVKNEVLEALLTPAIVKTVVEAFTKQHTTFKQYQPIHISIQGTSVYLRLGDLQHRISINGSKVSVTFPTTEQAQGEEIAQLLTTLLSQAADKLYADKLKQLLQKKFGKVVSTQANVQDGNQVVPVTMLKFEV